MSYANSKHHCGYAPLKFDSVVVKVYFWKSRVEFVDVAGA